MSNYIAHGLWQIIHGTKLKENLVIDKYIYFVSSTRNSRRLSKFASNQLNYCFLEHRLGFDKESNCGSRRSVTTKHRDKKKASAIFIDLTATYDIAITYKLCFNCKLQKFFLTN